ncbi:hypothetical protein F4780DRAFT_130892 [Xylariomycetidae sp. FL0641]|nr:hypothetical protein F4780DRAFT_130892 [Xylariomycetidae sp. FL0641]
MKLLMLLIPVFWATFAIAHPVTEVLVSVTNTMTYAYGARLFIGNTTATQSLACNSLRGPVLSSPGCTPTAADDEHCFYTTGWTTTIPVDLTNCQSGTAGTSVTTIVSLTAALTTVSSTDSMISGAPSPTSIGGLTTVITIPGVGLSTVSVGAGFVTVVPLPEGQVTTISGPTTADVIIIELPEGQRTSITLGVGQTTVLSISNIEPYTITNTWTAETINAPSMTSAHTSSSYLASSFGTAASKHNTTIVTTMTGSSTRSLSTGISLSTGPVSSSITAVSPSSFDTSVSTIFVDTSFSGSNSVAAMTGGLVHH